MGGQYLRSWIHHTVSRKLAGFLIFMGPKFLYWNFSGPWVHLSWVSVQTNKLGCFHSLQAWYPNLPPPPQKQFRLCMLASVQSPYPAHPNPSIY